MPPEDNNDPSSSDNGQGQENVTEQPVVEEQQQEAEITGHPAWQEILDVLPTSLHETVKPTLQKWDTGVQEKLNSVREEFAPYQDFVKNDADPEVIKQGLWLLDRLQTDPEAVAKEIIEAWELDLTPAQQQQAIQELTESNSEDPDDLDEFDITKHPDFIAMKQVVDELQSETKAQKEAREAQEATESIDNTLKKLHEDHGDFDDTYVLAFMSQGQDGATAVKQYQDTVNQAAERLAGKNNTEPVENDPVVMGGSSTTGSGLPSEPIQLGSLKASEREQLVAEMLSKGQQT